MPRRFIYYVIASLSGASALIFENLWFRSCALVLGSGAWSSALVLSAFMAGVALGNLLAMRFEARVRRPLRTYSAVELAIGLTGVAALVLLSRATCAPERTPPRSSASLGSIRSFRYHR